ncbi:type II toxin-antitoxin system Phd/YefM family antitoxin [Pararhizobium gei]|uniref:type II toxin-antitoxin system Phd/YefM family antitoxin n=1 Tax=Pararhizobium gei TaxID=1395951 RepID=UPI0023DB25E6|nr:type II toxin-antitoxin system prevent-host-death family antitoxin [Rhizobium gei]
MSTVSLRDVKTDLSELVDEVVNGSIVTITRDGKPVATLSPIEENRAEQPGRKSERSFVEHLKAFPEPGMVFERNRSPGRDVDL